MAIEIEGFPIDGMVIFHSYVSLPEGTYVGRQAVSARPDFEGTIGAGRKKSIELMLNLFEATGPEKLREEVVVATERSTIA